VTVGFGSGFACGAGSGSGLGLGFCTGFGRVNGTRVDLFGRWRRNHMHRGLRQANDDSQMCDQRGPQTDFATTALSPVGLRRLL